jgi:dimethylaniline monooxygenase (N-oxide forming)|uniref:Flavin-containing monooxygenase n=2 Tax=Fibrocapsa japonica TaxID=94617 RepID=A0A7S2UXY2_9STRA|mmetsp:Transcript_1963/g.2812  ORF Transcript_1963/g.2812 Transcript_1963/m.2812 type:complete len:549 (+) Transcript_1963:71-1717(+)|eukprot:CAMPEP_0113933974 /NCGR_PEP_ID=MMETSP1339-20121228/1329_1 /TAXON_ID=94617 /ORGANISM="Fibrocapsa japonica" /LENGTH=548 /DNA_ID=CAMNT_0000935569 /DNA_START=65 /DNA_END=1711 /DNA_ORIENTATION=- /assembly_acc=CAM_ASM_000762
MAEGQKHIMVLGAGASGLTVMKHLLELGHKVTCFELLPCIGGVYAKSYDNTFLTTSSCLTAYSDYSDGNEDKPKFWSDVEYLAYLKGFAEHFDLMKHIKFRTKVEKLMKCPKSGKWICTYKENRYVKPHRAYGEVSAEDPHEPEQRMNFDGVACATGTNNWASLPCFKGEEKFKGEIIHSENYRNPEAYAGKRVMIVGAGESGSDICNEISKHASSTAIVCRGKHGHLIPRIQTDGRVTDLNTNRCRYSNPYVFGDAIGWTNQLAKKFVATMGPKNETNKVLAKIGELNMHQQTSAFSKFGCKNAGFVEAIVQRGCELHRDSWEFTEDGAKFDDGSEFKCDIVVACTGYKNIFPFLEDTHPEIAAYGQNPRKLYKQVFIPGMGYEFAFFGFTRPAFGSIPPTSEMQARLFAMVVNGDFKLPSKKEMELQAELDRENWEHRFGYDAKRVKGLVDFQLYADELAEMMGCLPPLRKIFFNKPKLWFKIMFGPFTMHQYRLVGPWADPARAEAVYAKTPVGDFLEAIITAGFLVSAKILSSIGFRKYTPNNF